MVLFPLLIEQKRVFNEAFLIIFSNNLIFYLNLIIHSTKPPMRVRGVPFRGRARGGLVSRILFALSEN